MTPRVLVQPGAFDVAGEHARLAALGGGALVTFTGQVRGAGGVATLRLEHYPGMTERGMQAIAASAAERWPLLGLTAIHRVGDLAPGDGIVFVGAASRHRRAAFEAADFVMDHLKTRAVFWKQELAADGSGRWVESSAADHAAAAAWQGPPATR